MDKWITPLASLLILTSPLSARTWTSSDGNSTFKADFKSYNNETQIVTVLKHGYKPLHFPLNKLSKADQTWIQEEVKRKRLEQEAANAPTTKEALSKQKVGANLNSKVLSRFNGRRFVKENLKKAPEYYLLYFSASW